jgi:hypothetical protein
MTEPCIVEIQPGCWLAPWTGDPGRTLVRKSAKVFPSEWAARCAIARHRSLGRRLPYAIKIQKLNPQTEGETHVRA